MPIDFSLSFPFPTTQKGWAELYSVGDKTMSRWFAKGKKAKDPPPLHDPDALLVWYRNHHAQAPPFDLPIKCEELKQKFASPATSPSPSSSTPPTPGTARYEIPDFAPGAIDPLTSLNSVKKNLHLQQSLLDDAAEKYRLNTLDDAAFRTRQIAYNDALAAYQTAEKIASTFLLASKKSIPVDSITDGLREIVAPIPSQFRRVLKSLYRAMPTEEMASQFQSLAAATSNEQAWSSLCDSLVDFICEKIQESALPQTVAEIVDNAA